MPASALPDANDANGRCNIRSSRSTHAREIASYGARVPEIVPATTSSPFGVL